ncbi:MAG: hypothetical protein UV18_C0005G0120 [Candidatus Magasanikbacteria bacterium GW2011_GWC2_42_27]|uniref:Uncharacterized protein n=1 Tax=Candidatus Magasanikbacteria bacterium GW2011_GWE2_42_7 TaxID=1619052 RepID=A0A0G1BFS9_9BACT|nr:MAG: hypothetical protein UV18_C0005G0120 [Candidatus Magasanikbacteria bacterium GW2011_GWC2_42_27]KKS72127.1 MAG: hypothetical protein UV42_C0013G0005 [Candidatus Magasanikbacteria bacterium GW2011_GWE2_42_7]KKT25944.1 MAG: hypothetical protein UW10_C0003G0105 [Candidatus Magasanikbacteria bacterium GW2011_GWA2_43_9]
MAWRRTIGICVFGFSFLFSARMVFAEEMCCVYFEENNAGADTCYSFDTGAEVSVVNTDAGERCPANTYSGRLLGAYGFGPSTSGLPPEPTSMTYRESQVSKNCIALTNVQLDGQGGTTSNLEVKKEAPGSPLCQKGLTMTSLPLRRLLVKAQLEDLARTLATFIQGNPFCCVPRAPQVSTQCTMLGSNQRHWDQLYMSIYGGLNPTNVFYFPPADQLANFYSCEPNATERDWIEAETLDITKPLPLFSPDNARYHYVVYPGMCNTQAGTNYLPPWGYGNTSQIPQQLQAMCTLAGEKYCACSDDLLACAPSFYKTLEACKAVLPMKVHTNGNFFSTLTQCLKLDESDGAKISCSSLILNSLPDKQLAIEYPQVTMLNPIGTSSISIIAGYVIQMLLNILGSIALLIFLYGGFLWMTARGNPDHIQRALATLLWGALGIIVIFASYAIVGFVLQTFL